jgi:hypothetical protein
MLVFGVLLRGRCFVIVERQRADVPEQRHAEE